MAIDSDAFGPDQTTQNTRRAISAAGAANKVAGWGGYGVPYADTALGLANLFTDPTPQNAAKFAGSTLTSPQFAQTAARFLGDGANAAHGLTAAGMTASEAAMAGGNAAAGAAPGLAAGLASAGAGAAMGLFAGGGLLSFLDDKGLSARTRRRNMDASGVQGEVLRPLMEAKDAGGYRRAFSTPVGDSTVGDSILEVANSNLDGTWYADTNHNWRPDPMLIPLQRGLRSLGFTGRGPTRRDVGGMGEVVGGAGQNLIPRAELNAYDQDRAGRWLTNGDEGGYTPDATLAGYQPGPQAGAYGWSPYMRGLARLFGATDAPSVFGMGTPTPTMGTVDEGGQQGVIRETPDPAEADYMSALEQLLPDVAPRVRAADEAKRALRDALARANAGGE